MPTRYSWSLTSFGIPIRTLGLPPWLGDLGGPAGLRFFASHLDLALEEGPLGDHHPRRRDVPLQIRRRPDLHPVGALDVARHLAGDLDHLRRDRPPDHPRRADHDGGLDLHRPLDLAFDEELGGPQDLALDPGA